MEQRIVVSGKELVRIAKVTSSIGIKGGVKITPLFFNVEETMELMQKYPESIYLYSESIFPRNIKVKDFSKSKGGILASLEGLDSFEKAKASVGMLVLTEYKLYRAYIESTDNVLRYLGYKVLDKTLGELGVVKNINRSSQVLLEIEGVDLLERLVPFVKGLIEKIDHKDRIITMNLPSGIFE